MTALDGCCAHDQRRGAHVAHRAVRDIVDRACATGCDLTAAKRGCNQGVCGACSVLIGGEPARACLSLTANCVDRDITTVEGLSTPLALSPLQAAMVRAGAIQCGFCTPGMLIALTALLQEYPQPTREEIRMAVSSNLCRCTGYQKIVEAVARDGRQRRRMTSIHTSVGHSLERLDAAEKVTGEAQYVDDLYRPGMLHGAILGSIHAHAKIRGYKLDAAPDRSRASPLF